MVRTFLLLGLMLAACAKSPDDAARIAVSDAWARPTGPAQSGTAAYMTIANSGGGDRLTGVAADIGIASLHSTSLDGGVMRMRPVEAVDLPAGGSAELKPAGVHVMIAGLEQPLPPGSSFRLRLEFEKAGMRNVDVAVREERARG